MNFFKSVVNEALGNADTSTFLRESYRYMSDQMGAMQTSSNQIKIVKLSAAAISGLVAHSSSKMFAVYTEAVGKIIVLHVRTLYVIYRTSNVENATKVFTQLNALPEFENETDSYRLTELANLIVQHPDWRSIHFACALNCVNGLLNMLQMGDPLVVVSTCTEDGEFPLNIAASRGHASVVNILVKYDAAIDKKDSEGKTAVHHAAASDLGVLKALSQHEKFAHALSLTDTEGQTPLGAAITAGNIESVQLLISQGAATQHNSVPLWCCLLQCNSENKNLDKILRLLLAVDTVWLCEKDNSGKGFLHSATDPNIIERVLRYSVKLDVNLTDNLGLTPLHHAAIKNNLDVSILLLAYGANVDAIDGNGNTPLFYAIKDGYPEILKTLLLFNASQEQAMEAFNACTAMGRKKDVALILSSLRVKAKPIGQGVHDLVRQTHIAQHLSSDEKRKIALTLDGGGIRGLVLIQILKEIEAIGKIDLIETVEWIAGTSTGAILALALAQGKTIAECQNIYFRFKDAVFSGSRPYSAETLENFLKIEYGEQAKLSDLRTNVVVTSAIANVVPAKLQLFRSYLPDLPAETLINSNFIDPSSMPIWKAARCSSAAPSYFPSFENKFMDGGLIANNPTCELLSEVQLCNAAAQIKDTVYIPLGCVISLGTGVAPTVNAQSIDVDTSGALKLVQSIGAIMHMKSVLIEQIAAADGTAVDRSRAWCESLSVPFFRFTPQLSKDVLLDETDNRTIINMMWEAKVYMLHNSEEVTLLTNLVQSLKSHI